MNPAHQIKPIELGKSGVYVSPLCLGAMYFGTRIADDQSATLLNDLISGGGNFIDTANNYPFWLEGAEGSESEAFLGRWMKQGQRRNQIVLATKVGAMPLTPGGGFDQMEGLSSSAIERAVERSLVRLQTDHIDICYAHIDDRSTPLEETCGPLTA